MIYVPTSRGEMSSDTRVIQTRFRYLTFKEVTGLTKFTGFRSRGTVEAEKYVNYEDASSWTPANFHPSIYFVLNVFIFLCHRYYSRFSVLFLSFFLFCILRIFSLFLPLVKSLLYQSHRSPFSHGRY